MIKPFDPYQRSPGEKLGGLKEISGSVSSGLVEIYCMILRSSGSVIATGLIWLAVFLYTSEETESRDCLR